MALTTEQKDFEYEVWVESLDGPNSARCYRENVGGYSVAINWAQAWNTEEVDTAQREQRPVKWYYFPVRTTVVKTRERL